MNIASNIVLKVSTLASLLLISNNAFAGVTTGTISMTLNGATAVPTLGSSMLIVLCLLLFVVAFKVAKQKNASKVFMTLLGVTVLSTGVGGVKLISDSYAMAHLHDLTGFSVGEVRDITLDSGYNHIRNDHSTPMTIGQIHSFFPYFCSAELDTADIACDAGASLASGQTCGIYCYNGTEVLDL